MKHDEWLSTLATGSEVVVTGTWLKPRLSKVVKTTKTQIVVGNQRFYRETGRQIGYDRFSVTYLQQVSDEFRESQNRAALKEKILEGLDSATTEELAQINVILTKERP